ncbi:MAG: GlmU family protein [Tenuifilaceae bacterium]|nr:GlmU family protein [Tenuifilaceae bacterium]
MPQHTILFDDNRRENLLPLTFTRPVSMVRVGILTIKEKWEKILGCSCYHLTADYLQKKYPLPAQPGSCIMINGGVLPTLELINEINALQSGEAIFYGNTLLAAILPAIPNNDFSVEKNCFNKTINTSNKPSEILNPWDIFRLNGEAIESDFKLLTQGRKSQPVPQSNTAIAPEKIFIEEGAVVQCSVLNAQSGPIYIGKDSEVMEGSLIRGPFALGEHSALKLGAKIYGPTTIGPHSKVGGEVNNCVIFGYSNKAHDGFIGNSVIGEWCNLGADTNTSNLKNNYASVRLWSYVKKGFVDTGLQFCGLIMGDHSKCGINTMFNTGTVVGVSANIFGDGFPRNFIPSFSWGGAQGFTTYKTSKAFETAEIVMGRRGIELSEVDKDILNHIFDETASYRH